MNRYALYPGCNPQMAEPELLKATFAVAEVLGIELIKLDRVSCCGGAHLQDRNTFQSLLLNARNFTFAERLQLDLVTICNTCQYILAEAYHTLTTNPDTRKQVNTRLEGENLRFQGASPPRNFLYVLREDIGRAAVRQQVRRPLRGLKVASFYGCHLYSPSSIQTGYTDGESPWNPESLEELIRDLGGVDGDGRLGPPRMTAMGILSPRSMMFLTALSIGSAVLFGIPLVLKGGLPILLVGVSAILLAIAYTAGPFPLGKIDLGELFVFISFGPVAVLGSYYLQAGRNFSYAHLLGGAAVGLLGVALLSVNNLRDIAGDAASGKRTLAVRFGRDFGRMEIQISAAGAFALLCLTGFVPGIPLRCSLSGLTVVPLLVSLRLLGIREPGRWMNGLLAQTSLTIFCAGLSFFLLCALPG
jgi:1,4-dihydroxy-2-naphthoate octaprenyltransferase